MKKDAANLVVFKRVRRNLPVARNPCPHFLFSLSPILDCKCTPRKADRQAGEASEESPTYNEVLGAVELEKEGFARLKRVKWLAPHRPPEVHLVYGSAR